MENFEDALGFVLLHTQQTVVILPLCSKFQQAFQTRNNKVSSTIQEALKLRVVKER